MSVRVRFAPSNTGFLHMGNTRTALFNYLYARHEEGTFILRIEDTDRERSKDEYADAIIDALTWLGMEPDEGPIYQTSRFDSYREKIDNLLKEEKAYKCFCTPEELEQMREEAQKAGQKPKYSGKWRDRKDHPEDKPFVVRIKMPLAGTITVKDLVQGEVTVNVEELDDFIIMRSDGTPTYNFVVVVDDVDMKITHVIRGSDHLNNTFRQTPVYEALGHPTPTFAHLPLIDGLSKRKGSASVQDYRAQGFLPEAVMNYLSRLGWSHGDQEIFTPEELIAHFGFESVGKSPSSFDEDKFRWVNSEWMKALEVSDLMNRWKPFLEEKSYKIPSDESLLGITALMRDRADTLVALTEVSSYFFTDQFDYDEKSVKKWVKEASKAGFQEFISRSEALSEWNVEVIGGLFEEIRETFELGFPKLAQPIRISLTGSTNSPSVFELLAAFPKEEALRRLKKGWADLFEEL